LTGVIGLVAGPGGLSQSPYYGPRLIVDEYGTAWLDRLHRALRWPAFLVVPAVDWSTVDHWSLRRLGTPIDTGLLLVEIVVGVTSSQTPHWRRVDRVRTR